MMFFFKIYQKKQWRANEVLEWKAISSNQHVILETHKGALQFENKRDAPRVHFTNGVTFGIYFCQIHGEALLGKINARYE